MANFVNDSTDRLRKTANKGGRRVQNSENFVNVINVFSLELEGATRFPLPMLLSTNMEIQRILTDKMWSCLTSCCNNSCMFKFSAFLVTTN